LKRFTAPSTYTVSLMFDGQHLWAVDQDADKIYCINREGVVLTSFATPGTTGVGLAFDGQYFWHGDAGTDLIYMLSRI